MVSFIKVATALSRGFENLPSNILFKKNVVLPQYIKIVS